ncbi:MAG TPA: glycine cleavage system protein GcvH [Candidatus Brachybacterium merdigallinarum]|jgi:glycine cleavage system H protein|nr:glycine cleavage system protein GcvH [Candidatus Brachybacterium merdigallinarum]
MADDLRYSKDHEWVRVEDDGTAVIGVTDYAAEQLGDVVYVDLPEKDDEISAGTEMGEIESTKSVSDLFSPLDGTVLEINQAVVDAPELVNSSPFGEGWLIRVRVDTLPDDLMDAAAYTALTEG